MMFALKYQYIARKIQQNDLTQDLHKIFLNMLRLCYYKRSGTIFSDRKIIAIYQRALGKAGNHAGRKENEGKQVS